MAKLMRTYTQWEAWAAEACNRWNWNCNLAEVARDLIDNGPDIDTNQWDEVGRVFQKFFSVGAPLVDRVKSNWETITDIVREFKND